MTPDQLSNIVAELKRLAAELERRHRPIARQESLRWTREDRKSLDARSDDEMNGGVAKPKDFLRQRAASA
jgi:hypothetical protein